MELDFTVDCSEHNVGFCDFSIHVNLDFELFYKMIKREVDLLNEDLATTVPCFSHSQVGAVLANTLAY
jgi:hypothetical protein